MQRFIRAGVVAVIASAVVMAPTPTPPAVVHDVTLTAATSVPPGGLITSFLHNQTVYCSIICPLLAQTGVTAVTTTLQAPATFLAALSAGDVLKAIGAATASVTGPTEAALQRAIDADAAIPAQRALNAFQVGVVGLLNVLPAAQNGLPGIATALQQARQDTYEALNLPFVPNPEPTVMPRGVFQVAVVGAINVVAAVIFPAFNFVLAGVVEVPDAVAQELARTGNPVRAVAAGARTAGGVLVSAGEAITQAVVTAVDDVRRASQQPTDTGPATREADPLPMTNAVDSLAATTPTEATPTEATPTEPTLSRPRIKGPRTAISVRADAGPQTPASARRGRPNPLRDAVSTLPDTVRDLVGKVAQRPSTKNPDSDDTRPSTRKTGSGEQNAPARADRTDAA